GGVDVVLAAGGFEVAGHGQVVGEQGGGGADLGAHVADGPLAGGGDRLRARAEVLDDRSRPALHREDVGDLEDHVLGRAPPVELAGQVEADEPRPAHVEREAGELVDGVGRAETRPRESYAAPFPSSRAMRWVLPSTFAWMRWSQWTVAGTSASSRPAVMNWGGAIWGGGCCLA